MAWGARKPNLHFFELRLLLSYGNCETPLWDARGMFSANSLKVMQRTPHNINVHPALKTHNCIPGFGSRTLHGKLPICRATLDARPCFLRGAPLDPDNTQWKIIKLHGHVEVAVVPGTGPHSSL